MKGMLSATNTRSTPWLDSADGETLLYDLARVLQTLNVKPELLDDKVRRTSSHVCFSRGVPNMS